MVQTFGCATSVRKIQKVVELCYQHDLPITSHVGEYVGERLRHFVIKFDDRDELLAQWALKRAGIDDDTIIS